MREPFASHRCKIPDLNFNAAADDDDGDEGFSDDGDDNVYDDHKGITKLLPS